jgi:hypothetical protein
LIFAPQLQADQQSEMHTWMLLLNIAICIVANPRSDPRGALVEPDHSPDLAIWPLRITPWVNLQSLRDVAAQDDRTLLNEIDKAVTNLDIEAITLLLVKHADGHNAVTPALPLLEKRGTHTTDPAPDYPLTC